MAKFLRVQVKIATRDLMRVVQKRSAAAGIKALYQVGEYVRKTAQRSIRKSPKFNYSKPGDPPLSKQGVLRDSFAFAVDEPNKEVIIGPQRRATPVNVAKLHEFGGTVTTRPTVALVPNKAVRQMQYPKGKEPKHAGNTSKFMYVHMPATRVYKPRPFMGPALDKTVEKGKFPNLFADKVR